MAVMLVTMDFTWLYNVSNNEFRVDVMLLNMDSVRF